MVETATKLNTTIDGAVGKGGKNKMQDILTILQLLYKVPIGRGGMGKPNEDANKIKSISLLSIQNAIRDFQMYHFGVSNMCIHPGNMTISQLVKEVTGKRPPGKQFMGPSTFKSMVATLRDKIVQIGNAEANRADRPRGVAKNAPEGTRDQKQAARLKEYFKVYDTAVADSEFTKGRPGDTGYCGIFATWVVNQALAKCGFIGKLQFQNGGKIVYLNGNQQVRREFYQDGNSKGAELVPMNSVTYTKGDICLVKEHAAEKWPTHHFIVAEEPKAGSSFKTIEGNYEESNQFHGVTNKNTRTMLNYGFLSVLQPQEM